MFRSPPNTVVSCLSALVVGSACQAELQQPDAAPPVDPPARLEPIASDAPNPSQGNATAQAEPSQEGFLDPVAEEEQNAPAAALPTVDGEVSILEGQTPNSGGVNAIETKVTENCANTEVMAVDRTEAQPADIIFVIDTSPSMGEEIAAVRSNMNAFSQQIVDSGIDVRVIMIAAPEVDTAGQAILGVFGLGALDLGVCIDPPLGSGRCPEDDNLPAYAHVPLNVGSTNGLNVILESYNEWSQHLRPGANKAIVVVSDDNARTRPNNDGQTFVNNLEALDPQVWSEWTFNGIFCGSRCGHCSDAGAVYQELVSLTDGLAGELCEQDFQPVFDRLAEQIITSAGQDIACEWDVPAPPDGQSLSIDLVQVERSSDAENAVPLARVDALADCSDSAWYFDDPLSPKKILACPKTCEAMQDQQGGRIDVSFGCQAIAGCAESGSATLADRSDAPACELPLPPPPEGVLLDLSTINVRYDTELGFFGILGVVSDGQGCNAVGQGWHYDSPESPSAVVLCPETCAAYQAGQLDNIQAVFGCDAVPAIPRIQ